jgi:hypothetical protein
MTDIHSDSQHIKLPSNHVHAVRCHLAEVERNLNAILDVIEHPTNSGILKTLDESLSVDQRAVLGQLAQQMLDDLAKARDELGLGIQIESTHRRVSALLSAIWITLEETYARKLSGYGADLDPGTQQALDELVDRLIETVNTMHWVLQNESLADRAS